jgi:hypothetical protein
MDYDEDQELTRYIWKHYQHLMTELERRAGRAILGRAKVEAARARDTAASREMAKLLSERWAEVGVPEVDAALADGPAVFRRKVRDRLLSECGSEVFVNRCGRCKRVVRTPQARQCLWCGFDWH